MSDNDFTSYLRDRGYSEGQITDHLDIADRFEAFLEGQADRNKSGLTVTKADLLSFSSKLIESGENTRASYFALVTYGRFLRNEALIASSLTLVDGAEAMDNLFDKLGELMPGDRRDRLFDGVDRPVLGSDTADWPGVTQVVMDRVTEEIGEDRTADLLSDSLRHLSDAWYQEAKAGYERCRSFDEFLEARGDYRIQELTRHREEGTLYFTQPVTQEVIDFVESQPEIRQGVREGNILYETKIPYMTVDYLAEADPDKRRYYYCHCPWVRESLLRDDIKVPSVFCNCSSGFHKKYWEVVLGRPLKAEVLETVLQGDERCRFAIHLPDEVLS